VLAQLQAGEGRAIATAMPLLFRHPDTPPGAIHTIDAELRRIPGGAVAQFRAIGDVSKLVIPGPVPPERTDGLWKSTCFEIFVAGSGGKYSEYNLAPSGAWAAYEFEAYRQGMRSLEAGIEIHSSHNHKSLEVIAKIESDFPLPSHVGMTAVIEEADGAIRYWSTGFAPGKPDFHAEAVRTLFFDGVDAE
jgi:hypothetical protein